MSDNALLAAAHDYRKRGWRVIQLHSVGPDGTTCSCKRGANCDSKGKHPIDMAWQKTPALSAADIEALWEKRPRANVGLAVGEASGFWVLDIDPTSGGFETMAALRDEHGPLPATFTVQTGSGGWHYYFSLPDFELRNSSGRIGKGVDTRANGGQVVAAPSKTDRGAYVANDAPLAPAPAWLLEMARKTEVDPATIVTAEDLPRPEDIEPAEWERLNAYAKRAIDAELERLRKLAVTGWNGEPWNHTTFEASCSLIEFANSPWNAYSLGQAEADVLANTPRDTDGFDDWTVKKTFASAREKVGDKARPIPAKRTTPAEDPLFGGPDVRRRETPDPTQGGGANGAPVVGTSRVLFGGEKGTTPLYAEMAAACFDLGPIGWGRDQDFWSYADGVWKPDHYVVQHRLVDLLENAYKKSHTSNVSDVVQRHAQPIAGDPLERLMNFRNGMLDWRTGDLVDHDPAYGSTVQLGTIWDPEAECPQFEQFLHDVMHEDYVALAWEMLGYLMLSGNPHQVAFLFYGKGGNGKGTLLDLISRLLGSENVASETLDDLNGNRFRTASLFGKIANLAGDIDASYQEHTAMFKAITGEDTITGEHKNMPPFRFQSWAVPVFSVNKFFGSADVTDGYFRRWIVLHFHKRIPADRIVNRNKLMEILEAEMPGIAAKAVRALQVLEARGHFDPQGEALEGKRLFTEQVDQVRKWAVSGDAIHAPETVTPLADLYASYSIWAERSGQRKVREQEFSDRLENIGYPPERHAGQLMHKGLTVAPIAARTPANFF